MYVLRLFERLKQAGRVFVETPATSNIRSNSPELLNSTWSFSTGSILVSLGILTGFFRCVQLVERILRIGSVVKPVG